jgi:queuine tRNA-ribosyltransferase
MKFDLLKKTRSPKPERKHYYWSRCDWKHQFYARGYCSFSKRGTSLKEDINPDIIWETPIIYIYAHRSWRKPVVCINSWIGIIFWRILVGTKCTPSANRKIKEEGVKFKSHIDGSFHLHLRMWWKFSVLGADIIMAFDEYTISLWLPLRAASKMTHRWLDRCVSH